ncbi:MAG: carbamoyltransferase N-terminal domain-containing protein [Microthrixaceae bacterium]
MTAILGVSAYYHDSAAALVLDGVVVAAAQQERFSRRKHDADFPIDAVRYCLETAGLSGERLDAVAYYEKPLTSLDRVLKSFTAAGPRGFRAFPRAMDEMLRRKLWIAYDIDKALRSLGCPRPEHRLFAEHHVSHAAAAFHPSPFDSACILTLDGVGEWATGSIGVGRGRRIELVKELRFPHSLGLLYSAFTVAAGFRANSGEYKLMGLAPFGEPTYVEAILEHLVELRPDGSFTLDMAYFDFLAGRRMTNRRFDRLFGGPARDPDEPITQRECDLARSIQDVTETIVLAIAAHAHELTGEPRVALAGGVALNCVANGRLLRHGPFDQIWVQPAAGDAGSAIGAALWAYHDVFANDRTPATPDGMHGSLLGPRCDPDAVAAELTEQVRPYERLDDPGERARRVAGLLADGKAVAVLHGPMEFGPRALGARSILADPRGADTQRRLNRRIKRRESFRPFAPAVLAEHTSDWFDLDAPSPYMTLVAPVRNVDTVAAQRSRADNLTDRLALVESPIPAVTHVDGSARVQTVTAERSPELHRILTAFHELTDCPVLLNTSFNVRGEPIVATAQDAYRCFMTTDLDALLLETCLLYKEAQPPWTEGPAPVTPD